MKSNKYCFKNLSRTSDLPISQLGRHSHNWFLMLSWKVGLKVYFWVHLRSFASKIFFHWQAGETTSKFFPFVWEKWMILTCRLSKSVAFCIASVNFEPWKVNHSPKKFGLQLITFFKPLVTCYCHQMCRLPLSLVSKWHPQNIEITKPKS